MLINCQLYFAQQSLIWANALNGTGSSGYATITDALGNIYNCGSFSGTVDFDPGSGVFNLTASGVADVYLTKLDANGNLIWVKNVGSGSTAYATSIKLDPIGNICLGGYFTGTIDFDPSAAIINSTSAFGSSDVFIAKYSPVGNFIFAKSVGNGSNESTRAMDLDALGNIYVSGAFQGTTDFDPGPFTATLTSTSALLDGFLLKLDFNGNYVWAIKVGGVLNDACSCVFIDAVGNVWSTGYFASVVDFDPHPSNSYTLDAGASYGAYIYKLDEDGNFLMAKALTAQVGYMDGYSILTDDLGNIYTSGYANGTIDFDPSATSDFTITTTNSNDIFISKLNPSGDFIWAKVMGGSGIEIPYSIALDSDHNIYSTGEFAGTADFDPSIGVYTLTSQGGKDIFISKLDVNGNFVCAGRMGGINDDGGRSIHIDALGNIHNSGYYSAVSDFDPSGGVFNLTASGVTETYLSKYARLVTGAPLSYTVCDGEPTTLVGLGANTYSWSPAFGLSSTTGNTVIATPSVTTSYTVLGTGNCFNTSTLITISVKPKPSFVPPISPQKIICIPDSTFMQSTSTNTNTIFKWRLASNSTYTNQPFYAKIPSNHYAKVIDVSNGCADSSLIIVKDGKIPPNAKLISHTYINALTPIDTVTCYQPSVTLLGASDTTGVVISWKSVGSNSVYPNPVSLTSLSNLKLFVKRNDNQCSDSSLVALVNQDNTLPNAIITNTNTQINCSFNTTTLSALFSPSTCTSLWNTPSTSTITNPSSVSMPGKYKLAITNPDNGCVKFDSVNVTQTNSIVISVSNNYTVCKSSPVTLTAQAIGALTGVGYLWNNSQTTNSIMVSNSVTTNYIVTATSGTCAGSNTINVTIPSDIQDSIIAYRSCNDNTTGTILIFAKGGISPYRYSINNGASFLSTNSFTGIPFGNYSVVIKDTLGCLRQTTVSVSAGNTLPTPLFLASTKNYKSDTIVLVDVSIPKPDSVQWVLPPIATKIGGTMFSPIVVFSDTGNFVVTMKGFYGNCIINATKLVRFAPYDTLVANYNNANGIKTFSLYPNPNTGQFNVFIEFYKKQSATIQVWDVSPYKHYQQNFYDVLSITLPVDVSFLQNGSYMLRVIAEFDAKNRAFIISK